MKIAGNNHQPAVEGTGNREVFDEMQAYFCLFHHPSMAQNPHSLGRLC